MYNHILLLAYYPLISLHWVHLHHSIDVLFQFGSQCFTKLFIFTDIHEVCNDNTRPSVTFVLCVPWFNEIRVTWEVRIITVLIDVNKGGKSCTREVRVIERYAQQAGYIVRAVPSLVCDGIELLEVSCEIVQGFEKPTQLVPRYSHRLLPPTRRISVLQGTSKRRKFTAQRTVGSVSITWLCIRTLSKKVLGTVG